MASAAAVLPHSAPGEEQLAALMEQLRLMLPAEVAQGLTTGGEPGLNEQTLRRWLVARKLNLKHAAADLAMHAAWRAQWAPTGRIHESEVAADIAQDKVFIGAGPDVQGRGLIVFKAQRHTMTETRAQQRYISYVLDTAIAMSDSSRNPDDKVAVVFELQGIERRNCDAVGLKNIFHLLASHYVERLSQLFMVGAPTIFWGLWALVGPFVDPVTRRKIVFVSNHDQALLLDSIGAEVLPEHLGGRGPLVPVDQAMQRIRQQQQQEPQQGACGKQQQAAEQAGHGQEAAAGAGAAAAAAAATTKHADKQQQHHAAAVCGAASMCGQEQQVLPGLPSLQAPSGAADGPLVADAAVVVGQL